MSDRLVAIGAEDPEMRAITERLDELGLEYAQATDSYGSPVHCGVAYNAVLRLSPELVRRSGLVTIETHIPQFEDETVVAIDHHNPGDRGFDMPVDEAVAASSLGQAAAFFGFKMTDRERTLGAVDHSFLDTIAGRVTGIDPEYGLRVKSEEIAATHGLHLSEVKQAIEDARDELLSAPRTTINGNEVHDLSDTVLGLPNSLHKLTIQAAAAMDRQSVLFRFQEYPGGPIKVMYNSVESPDDIAYFIDTWAPERGLDREFGVPNRHYGGAYVPDDVEWVPPSQDRRAA